MTATGRKKLDELYHSVTERSEFYSMVDLHKPPVLFSPPAEHAIDKVIPSNATNGTPCDLYHSMSNDRNDIRSTSASPSLVLSEIYQNY